MRTLAVLGLILTLGQRRLSFPFLAGVMRCPVWIESGLLRRSGVRPCETMWSANAYSRV